MPTVMSFNLRNDLALGDGVRWWGFRRKAACAAITALAPDLVGLQEVRPMMVRDLRRHLPGYEVLSAGRDDGRRGEACTVLVAEGAYRVEGFEVRWLSPRPTSPGSRWPGAPAPRIASLARVRSVAGDERLGFANVHLDASSAERRARSVELLAGWLAEEADRPWVVVGDFNCRIDDPVLAPLRRVGLVDALAHLPAEGTGAASHHSWTGRVDGDRIDHVFVPRTAQVQAAGIRHDRPHGRLPSDHWPVTATVTL